MAATIAAKSSRISRMDTNSSCKTRATGSSSLIESLARFPLGTDRRVSARPSPTFQGARQASEENLIKGKLGQVGGGGRRRRQVSAGRLGPITIR